MNNQSGAYKLHNGTLPLSVTVLQPRGLVSSRVQKALCVVSFRVCAVTWTASLLRRTRTCARCANMSGDLTHASCVAGVRGYVSFALAPDVSRMHSRRLRDGPWAGMLTVCTVSQGRTCRATDGVSLCRIGICVDGRTSLLCRRVVHCQL